MSERIGRRTRLVYGGLAALWLLVLAWQILEHLRVRRVARVEVVNRAKDISGTLGLVIRSQRRFGGLVSKDRIESALTSLIKPGELNAIALLNDAEEVVASAGSPIDLEWKALVPAVEFWGHDTVALINLVDLGTNVGTEDARAAAIVMPRGEMPPFGTNRPPPGPPPPNGESPRPRPNAGAPSEPPVPSTNPATAADGTATSAPPAAADGGSPNAAPRPRQRPRRGEGRFPFDRPFWMSEAEYRSLAQKQGVHSFLLILSTRSMQETCRRDLFIRAVIALFGGMSAIGLALAWRNLAHSSDLELRLARAAELNARLKEMNLAAAGLAHETRNPLNIIRGLAQMISRQPETSTEVHGKARDIIAETDRVTAQLNEFINYSRPREVRWSVVPLGSVVGEVARALSSDLEERSIRLAVAPDLPSIEGDEQLVRQALFNLLLNAVQAVDRGGEIAVTGERTGPGEFRLEIRDDGPGVRPEHRTEIFKPYFTTHTEGTGLGLAIVHQIVLAHGWEIDCVPNQPRGAVFRLDHLKLAARP